MSLALHEFARLGAEHPLAPDCEHFYFLRHGQTARNLARIFQAPDEPLNETGLAQAREAAALLVREPLRTIVCSDAQRAFDTAHVVAAGHGIAPLASEGLRERNFGALIGTSSAQLDWTCEPENGETLATFMRRKQAALAQALALPGPVLVVAHGGSLYALTAMLGIAMDLQLLGNAQPLRFERSGPIWTVRPLSLQQAADREGSAIA